MDCLKVLASHLISRPVSWVTLTSCPVIAFTQQKKKKMSTSPSFALFQGTKFSARVLHSPQLLVDKALGGNVVLEKAALDLSDEGGKKCVRAVLKAGFLGPGHS